MRGRGRGCPKRNACPFSGRFCEGIEARFEEINVAWTAETGATVGLREGMAKSGKAGWDALLKLAEETPLTERRQTPGDVPAEVRHEPIGVVVGIMTYNGPLTQTAKKIVSALLVGCTVVAKPAAETNLVARLIAEAAEAAGFPEGVLTIMAAGGETAGYLCQHPGVDMVSFTGGTAIGSQILAASARRIGKCALELGGKSAAIFADDADLEASLPALLGGMMPFEGQICTTRSRLLVSCKRHDEVVEAVVEGLRSRVMGDPQDPATTWGPLAIERARSRVEALVEAGRQEGATVATGGRRPEDFARGWFYEPTLFTGVDNSMRIAQDEAFGPMYCVIPYKDIDDAIRIANDSHLGLAGSVYTSDTDLALDVAHRVRSGTFAINGSNVAFTQPFGGMKQSGLGREGGLEGLYEYCDVKTISLA